MSTTTCPVLRPSMEEFFNFPKYLHKLEEEGVHLEGICKVIPPAGWFVREDNYDLSGELGKRTVTNPNRQFISGKMGAHIININETKDMNVKEFSNYCAQHSYESDHSEDSYAAREKQLWRAVGLNSGNSDTKSPLAIYGSDVKGSLFGDNHACGWNVNELDTPIKRIDYVPGVSDSMLYFGSWKSMFAFHTEDFDLHSINYLHTGAPKSWYGIPLAQRKCFESIAEGYFTRDKHHCKEYLRHKTYILSPARLKEGGLKFHTAVQEPGEFMITFAGGYHSGFNHGFNIAEATNFVTEKWIKTGLKAAKCTCRPDLIRVDVIVLETHILRAKKSQQLANDCERNSTLEACVPASNVHGCSGSSSSCSSSSSTNCVDANDIEEGLLRCECGDRFNFEGSDPLPPDVIAAFDDSTVNGLSESSSSSSTKKNGLSQFLELYSDAISLGVLFQCCECDCWGHTACTRQTRSSDRKTCHWCREINLNVNGVRVDENECESVDENECESEGNNDDDTHSMVNVSGKDAHTGTAQVITADSGTLKASPNHPRHFPNEKERDRCYAKKRSLPSEGHVDAGLNVKHRKKRGPTTAVQRVIPAGESCGDNRVKTPNRKRRTPTTAVQRVMPAPLPKRRRRPGTIAKGVRVYAYPPAASSSTCTQANTMVPGIVSDVYCDSFRFHVKGIQKGLDPWIKIQDYASYSLEPPSITSLSTPAPEPSSQANGTAHSNTRRVPVKGISAKTSAVRGKKKGLLMDDSCGRGKVGHTDEECKNTSKMSIDNERPKANSIGNSNTNDRCKRIQTKKSSKAGSSFTHLDSAMDRLISCIEASNSVCRKQQLWVESGHPLNDDDTDGTEGHFSSLHEEFPLYLSKCELLFVTCKPGIAKELKKIYSVEMKEELDNYCVNAYYELRVLLTRFQSAFIPQVNTEQDQVSSSSHGDPPAQSPSENNIFLYDGFYCSLSLLLEIVCTDLHLVVTKLEHSRSLSSATPTAGAPIERIPIFIEYLSRLIKLTGIEDSVQKLGVEFSKLCQTSELNSLKIFHK